MKLFNIKSRPIEEIVDTETGEIYPPSKLKQLKQEAMDVLDLTTVGIAMGRSRTTKDRSKFATLTEDELKACRKVTATGIVLGQTIAIGTTVAFAKGVGTGALLYFGTSIIADIAFPYKKGYEISINNLKEKS